MRIRELYQKISTLERYIVLLYVESLGRQRNDEFAEYELIFAALYVGYDLSLDSVEAIRHL